MSKKSHCMPNAKGRKKLQEERVPLIEYDKNGRLTNTCGVSVLLERAREYAAASGVKGGLENF